MTTFSAIHTYTIDDLILASDRYQSTTSGPVSANLVGRYTYLATSLLATASLLTHLALTFFALFALGSKEGRSFYLHQQVKGQIDLLGMGIGTIGVLSPWLAGEMTAAAFQFIDHRFLARRVTDQFKLTKGIATPELAIIDQFKRAASCE